MLTGVSRQRIVRGSLALMAGILVNMLGDRLLGVQIELFWGLATFSFAWLLDVFLVPFIAGMVVGMVFGLGGKWLCYFPPLIVRCISYFTILHYTGIPQGASLIPLGWWGFFVILVIEAAAFGGVAGEILIKRTYGRLPKQVLYKKHKPQDGSSKTGN